MALCALALPATAAPRTCTWTGGSPSISYWGSSFNWDILPGGGSLLPQNGDNLVFPAGAPRSLNTNNLPSRNFNSILIEGTGYTLRDMGTNAITLTNGVLVTYASPGGSAVIELDINVIESQTFESRSGNTTLHFTGDLDLAGAATILTLDSPGNIWLEDVVISGTGGLNKGGVGTLYMTGAGHNSYTGPTRVNLGRLHLAKTSTAAIQYGELFIGNIGDTTPDQDLVTEGDNYQIGDNVPITVYRSGWLNLNGQNDTVGNLTLDGGHISTGVDPSVGTLTLGGNVTVTDHSGHAAVIEGQIRLSGTRTFEVANTAYSPDLAISATISGPGGLTKAGSGALGLYGDNTGYTGTVTVNAGLVYLQHDLALGSTAAGTVVNDGGVLVLPGGRNIGAEPLTLNGGGGSSGALASSSGVNTWAGPITLASDSDITVRPGSELELSGAIGGPGGFTKAQRDETFAQTGTLILSGPEDNTFEGDAHVDAGVLEMHKDFWINAIPTTLHVGTSSGASHSVVARNTWDVQLYRTDVVVNKSGLYDVHGCFDIIGNLTLNHGGDVDTGGGYLVVAGGSGVTVNQNPLLLGTVSTISGKLDMAGDSLTFNVDATTQLAGHADLEIDAVVIGPADIIKEGPGIIQLEAANTFSGDVVVNAGTLCVTHASALGATAGSTLVNNAAKLVVSGALAVGNELLTLNSTAAGALSAEGGNSSWAGDINLATDAILNVAAELDVSGVISGVGGFTKLGAGTLVSSGSSANTLSGAVTVNEGVLALNKATLNSTIPASVSSLIIGDGVGGLDADVVRLLAGSQIHSGVPITIVDRGLLDLNGHDDSVGPLTFHGGVLRTHAGTATLQGNVAVFHLPTEIDCSYISGRVLLSATRTFYASNDARLIIDDSVGGSGGIIKTGAGEIYLSGSNDYSGLTMVREGVVRIGDPCGLGTTNAGTIVSNNASLILDGYLTDLCDAGVTNEALTLNGVGVEANLAALHAVTFGGTVYWTGPITLNATSTIGTYRYDPGAELRVTGAIGGAGGLTKIGNGKLYFDGSEPNTYAGTTRVDDGTLILGKNGGGAIPGALSIAGTVRMAVDLQTSALTDVDLEDGGLLEMNGCMAYINRLTGRGRVDVGTAGKWLVAGSGGGSSTFDGVISGAGDFYKDGNGTLTLTGANTLTGKTRAQKGTLLVNGYQPQSPVDFHTSTSSSLGGSGVVGPISVKGHLRPGTSPGCLTSGSLTFASSGTLHVELNGTTPCAGYDQLIAGSTHDLGGATLQVTTAFPPSDPVSLGDQFAIINNDGAEVVTGMFDGLPEGTEFDAGAYRFRINYGNDVVLTVVGLPLSGAAAVVSAGNGNHVIDPNECNFLDLVLTNQTGSAMNNVAAVLSTTHQRAQVTQPYSVYPDIPNGERRTNTTPFQLSTLANFPGGDDLPLQLVVATSTHGTFVLPLTLASGNSADGGGFCDLCLPPVSGVIEVGDKQQLNRWQRDRVVGSCGAPKAWTGLGAAGNFHYDVHAFTNLTAAEACVTVNLQSDSDVMAAMYLDSFNPIDIQQNYHGDAGCSTAENGGRTTFSAAVPAGARFLVTVNEVTPNPGTLPYTLTLSGLPCPLPMLAAEPAPADKVRVHWPTWAGGYKLEASTNLAPLDWHGVTNEPMVGGGRYNVTNTTLAPTNQFYRLHKTE